MIAPRDDWSKSFEDPFEDPFEDLYEEEAKEIEELSVYLHYFVLFLFLFSGVMSFLGAWKLLELVKGIVWQEG
jgi:hypothetical protein